MTNIRQNCLPRGRSPHYFKTALLVLWTLLPIVQSQFCRRIDNTWAGLVRELRAIEDSSGYGILCAFEISGDDCPSPEEYPSGYPLREGSNLILICDPDLFGYNSDKECIINCPGVHFGLEETASLTLDGMTLMGATDSSIQVGERATVRVINSVMRNNSAGEENGGVIRAGENAVVDIEYSSFTDNAGILGGAVYSLGDLRILETTFDDNFARVAGGAVAGGPFRTIDIQRSSFHGNQAANGGAIYLQDYSRATLVSNSFVGNHAIDGGAVYNSGISSIVESVFMDNYAENGGGGINCEAGSVTSIHRSQFINNIAGNVGPAVHDRFNTRVDKAGNTACGNVVSDRNSECDGIFVRVSRRRVRCLPFEQSCIAPTQQPSNSPSETPTMSQAPSQAPSSNPTSRPSSQPSISQEPSQTPSLLASSIPSNTPSQVPSVLPSSEPSGRPSSSTFPSLPPSETPSSVPSVVPSDGPTSSVAPSDLPSGRSSENPTVSTAPSGSPSLEPSGSPSSSIVPSWAPSDDPSSSIFPSGPPSALPKNDDEDEDQDKVSGGDQQIDLGFSDTSAVPSDFPSLMPSIPPTVAPSVADDSDSFTGTPSSSSTSAGTMQPTSSDSVGEATMSPTLTSTGTATDAPTNTPERLRKGRLRR